MERPPSDDEFLRQLEAALGVDRAQALDALGSWLTRYQPLGSYRLSVLEPGIGCSLERTPELEDPLLSAQGVADPPFARA